MHRLRGRRGRDAVVTRGLLLPLLRRASTGRLVVDESAGRAAQALAYREIVAPELKELKRTVEGMNRSGGLIGISAKLNISDEPEEPTMDESAPTACAALISPATPTIP